MKIQCASSIISLTLKLSTLIAFSLSPLFAADSTGSKWVAMNSGYKTAGAASCLKVTALKVDKSGTLYAGGTFRNCKYHHF